MKEKSALHLLFGLPARAIRYSLGFQMFGFREKTPQQQQQQTWSSNTSSAISASSSRAVPSAATASGEAAAKLAPRGRVRLSGFGQVGMGGSVALCDPASGLAFAMVTNKVNSCRQDSGRMWRIFEPKASWLLCSASPPHLSVPECRKRSVIIYFLISFSSAAFSHLPVVATPGDRVDIHVRVPFALCNPSWLINVVMHNLRVVAGGCGLLLVFRFDVYGESPYRIIGAFA